MDYRTLIGVEDLERHLSDASLVVFDCRHDLFDPDAGAREYAKGHVPGARFAHTDRDLAGAKTGRNGRHPLPEPAAFAAWLGRNGVDSEKQVIAYDFAAGSSAARLWWMLRFFVGHERAAVLDGGWEAWVAAGAPVTADVPRIEARAFVSTPSKAQHVDAVYVESHLSDPAILVLDARAPARYRGESEPIDPVAGHIPGAFNRFYKDNLDEKGRFKGPTALRTELEGLLAGRRPEQVVHQCGSGVTACSNLLAMEIAGLAGSRLYPGSWSEWSADPRRPIARSAT